MARARPWAWTSLDEMLDVPNACPEASTDVLNYLIVFDLCIPPFGHESVCPSDITSGAVRPVGQFCGLLVVL